MALSSDNDFEYDYLKSSLAEISTYKKNSDMIKKYVRGLTSLEKSTITKISCVIDEEKIVKIPNKTRLIIISGFGLFSTIAFTLFPFPSNILGFISFPMIIKQLKLMKK